MVTRRLRPRCLRLTQLGAALLGLVAPLSAQRHQPSSHIVRGVLFDSIAFAPLVGAEVHLARRDTAGTPLRARTDFQGRYTLQNVPSGAYVLGFYHEALDLLGLDAPVQGVDLARDSVVEVNLSIPSGGPVRFVRCGGTAAEAAGNALLAGFVRTAAGRRPVPGAVVTATWSTVSTTPGMLRTEPGRATQTIGDDGGYAMCDIPSGVVLTLDVQAPGYRAIAGPVTIPESGVLRQDALLVDTATRTGFAELRGRVLTERGQPVVSGRVRVAALDREALITDGAFTMLDVPQGTWVIEVRAIGIEPRALVVQASARRNATLLVRVSDQAQRLDAVTITGRADLVIHVLDAVLARHRVASGSVFLPGSPQLRQARRVVDLLSNARGFTVVGQSDVRARNTVTGERCRKIGVYVDGVRAIEGIEALDAAARPDQVLAVEAYPDVMSAPFEWRTSDGTCAVVALWTRR